MCTESEQEKRLRLDNDNNARHIRVSKQDKKDIPKKTAKSDNSNDTVASLYGKDSFINLCKPRN